MLRLLGDLSLFFCAQIHYLCTLPSLDYSMLLKEHATFTAPMRLYIYTYSTSYMYTYICVKKRNCVRRRVRKRTGMFFFVTPTHSRRIHTATHATARMH